MRFTFALFISCLLNINLAFGQVTQLRSADCNRVNTSLTKVLYASIASADAYRFKVFNTTTGITDSIDNPSRSFFLDQMPLISRYNSEYDVEVSMSFDGGSNFGAYGGVCNPESKALVTALRSPDCGRSLTSISQTLYASLNIGDSWDFEIRNVTDPSTTEIVTTPTRAFNLPMTSSIDFQLSNQEYEIRVRTTQGGVLQPYGSWCSVFTPTIITELRPSDCGRSLTSISQTLYASLNIGDSWDFEVRNVTDPSTTEIVTTLTRAFNLAMTSSIDFQLLNQEYEIRVRTTQGGVLQPYGSWCSVFTPTIITELRPPDCGRLLTQINTPLYAQVDGADSYDFEIRNVLAPGVTEVISTPTRLFRLTMASAPFQLYNQEYEIRVRTIWDGVNMPYGDWCSVFSPPSIGPDITDGCGNTFEYLAYEYLTCTDIGATQYEWLLRIGSTFIDTLYTNTNQARL
ncbi:MAG: hypothetical protein QNL86_05130, partial [Crocinitomicaceae bacterium]